MNASEARRIANNSIASAEPVGLDNIKSLIKNAAADGRYSIIITRSGDWASPTVLEYQLNKLGFETSYTGDGSLYIKWSPI